MKPQPMPQAILHALIFRAAHDVITKNRRSLREPLSLQIANLVLERIDETGLTDALFPPDENG